MTDATIRYTASEGNAQQFNVPSSNIKQKRIRSIPNPPRKPTVVDVARAADVAASTVSRCLRGGPYVSPGVRARVLDAVRTLGYEPNEVARSLRGEPSRSIGLIVPDMSNFYFNRCVEQIERAAALQGKLITLLTHQEDPKEQSRQIASMRQSGIAGLILIAASTSDMDALRLEVGGVPVVAFDRPLWGDADLVMLEHHRAAYDGTRHLLEHGHKRVACVTAIPNLYCIQERIRGYQEAMRSAGLRPIVISEPDSHSLADRVRGTLLGSRIDALFSFNIETTRIAIQSIRETQSDRRRPVALLGFGDVPHATMVEPSLSVMTQPTQAMARECVRMLLRRLSVKRALPVQRFEATAQLISRRSCGCALN